MAAAAAARVARVKLRSRLGCLLLTWTHLTVPNARSPVRGEGVHSLAPSLFLSLRVLVFALPLCPPLSTRFPALFAPIAAALLLSSLCFWRLPSVPFLLLYMPSPLRRSLDLWLLCALSLHIYSPRVSICISGRVKVL